MTPPDESPAITPNEPDSHVNRQVGQDVRAAKELKDPGARQIARLLADVNQKLSNESKEIARAAPHAFPPGEASNHPDPIVKPLKATITTINHLSRNIANIHCSSKRAQKAQQLMLLSLADSNAAAHKLLLSRSPHQKPHFKKLMKEAESLGNKAKRDAKYSIHLLKKS